MKKTILFLIAICTHQLLFSQSNSWSQKASLPGPSRLAAMNFSMNQYGYVCTGNDSNEYPLRDNWEYNPVTDTWTQKSNVLFSRRLGGIAFTVGTKSYCGFGVNLSGNTTNDLWEYDDLTDSWTQKSNCPGSPRALTTSFVIGNLAYVTCGVIDIATNDVLRDCWEYDPQNNSWIVKSDLPGVSRLWPVTFVVDGEAYVGTGSDSLENSLTDFYRYNNTTDTWTQLSNSPVERSGAIGCSLNNTGYIGLGFNSNTTLDDLWSYNKSTDTWNQAATFPGGLRDAAYMFVLNDKLYTGGGEDQNYDTKRDLWEYTPDTTLTGINGFSNSGNEIKITKCDNLFKVILSEPFHLPANLDIYSLSGSKLLSAIIVEQETNLTVEDCIIGKYIYIVEDRDKKYYSGSVKIF
jgi:N-acetylneuraminic acid mutarotase